jgi:hypothetical protein
MPPFGLVAGITFILIAMAIGVIQSWRYAIPQGLMLHLLKPGPHAQAVGGIQPLYVRLESLGMNERPALYVNSQRVAWEDFGNLLQRELRHRPPSWPVYLEGDRDLQWCYAVEVIDKIRGFHIEAVLLTGRR